MTVFDMGNSQHTTKQMMYGAVRPKPRVPRPAPQHFRLERGVPYQRRGKLVFATPQFKSQAIYSITNKNAQLPSTTTTPGSIIHPYRTV